MLCTGQLLIVPATKATTANAVVQSNSLQSNGGVENDNAIKANEVVESNGVLIQNRTSPKKSLLSVSTLLYSYCINIMLFI